MKQRLARRPSGRYTVDAAAKAFELLNAFSFRQRRRTLSDLAAETGIPRATAFRLLTTLEQAGLIAKEGAEYRLGIKCLVLGSVVADDLDVREKARPHLVALRDATRETAHIAVLHQWQVVYLERVPSPQPVGFMQSRAGAILPAYCTALGKTLLAYRPEPDVAAWAAQGLPALTPHTNTSARALVEELRAIRERGYAVDEQEHELGVRCIAAPIRDYHGDVVAAISVAGPEHRMPAALIGSSVARQVCASARAISLELGAVDEDSGSSEGLSAAVPAHGGRR